MENQRERDCKAPKLKTIDGIIAPIINLTNPRRYSSHFDPYASDSSNSPSPLMKYFRSADPASSIDSSPVFITPMKVEEDVIVMDGIPVPKSNRGGGEPRLRFPASSSDSIIGGRSNSASSISGGSGNRGNVTDNIKSYKHKLCRFWESTGICQFGSECQFAHGKEELRPPRSSGKAKIEIYKLTNNSEVLSSSSYGTKYFPNPINHQAKAEEETSSGMAFPGQIAKLEQRSNSNSKIIQNSTMPRSNWSPQDDGIDTKLSGGSKTSKTEVDAMIDKVLYEGSKPRKRLSVFEDVCRE